MVRSTFSPQRYLFIIILNNGGLQKPRAWPQASRSGGNRSETTQILEVLDAVLPGKKNAPPRGVEPAGERVVYPEDRKPGCRTGFAHRFPTVALAGNGGAKATLLKCKALAHDGHRWWFCLYPPPQRSMSPAEGLDLLHCVRNKRVAEPLPAGYWFVTHGPNRQEQTLRGRRLGSR